MNVLIAVIAALAGLAATQSVASPMLTFDARGAAMGSIGVASGVKSSPLTNPAILAYGVEFVDWFLTAPLYGQDTDDPNNFENLLDDFEEARANMANNPDSTRVQRTEQALSKLDGATLIRNEVFSMFATVPSNVLGAGLFFNIYSFTSFRGAVGSYDLSDPSVPVYNSKVQKSGVTVIEHGVALAQVYTTDFRAFDTFSVGIAPKMLLWQAVARSEEITTADTKARFGGSRDGSAFTLDVGLLRELGRFYTAGVTIKNLFPAKIRYPEPQGGSDTINTQVRAGVAYERRSRSYEVDLDLVPNSGIGFQHASRNLSIGSEFVLTHYLQLRAGLKQNFLGDKESLLTFGLGMGVDYTLDLAIIGGADHLGATAQFALAF